MIPELCKVYGITEDDKNNWNFMKNLAIFTKLEPEKRIKRTDKHAKKMS